MVLTLSKYQCFSHLFVMVILSTLIDCQRIRPFYPFVYYSTPLLNREDRNTLLKIFPKRFPKVESGDNAKNIFDSNFGQNHNHFIGSDALHGSKYLEYGFKDEYFPQKLNNPKQEVDIDSKYLNKYRNNQLQPKINRLRQLTFIPKTIPLIRATVNSNIYPASLRTIMASYNIKNPSSEMPESFNSLRMMKTKFGDKTNAMDSDLFTKGNRTNVNSTNLNVFMYGIYKKVYPIHPVTETMLKTNIRGSQVPQIPGSHYPRIDINNIPKEGINSDIIISKEASEQFNSDKSSVAVTVGVDEGPTNNHVNKNFYVAGDSTGLRQSRLNNIAVVVSSSMTVKED